MANYRGPATLTTADGEVLGEVVVNIVEWEERDGGMTDMRGTVVNWRGVDSWPVFEPGGPIRVDAGDEQLWVVFRNVDPGEFVRSKPPR